MDSLFRAIISKLTLWHKIISKTGFWHNIISKTGFWHRLISKYPYQSGTHFQIVVVTLHPFPNAALFLMCRRRRPHHLNFPTPKSFLLLPNPPTVFLLMFSSCTLQHLAQFRYSRRSISHPQRSRPHTLPNAPSDPPHLSRTAPTLPGPVPPSNPL